MKALIKSAAAIAMFAFAAPAFAGGVTVAEDGDSKLKMEALFYLNTTMDKTDTQAGTTAKSVGLAVDRAYLTLKYSFNSDWMMRFTTDINRDTALAGKKQNVYLKYAYLEGKLAGDAAVLRLGQSHTPWIDYEQGLWKHRYVSKVMTDTLKFDDSSDLGIGLKGKLADGLIGYWVTETTGAGYGNSAGSTNAVDLNARVGIYPIEGLTLDVQFRDGYRGTKTWNAATQTNNLGTKSTLTQVMATYGMGHDFRVGANYISNKAVNKTTNVTTKTTGFGLWAWANFNEQFGAFGRYESSKAKVTNVTVDAKTTRYVAGLEYTPVEKKNIHFSLATDYSKTTNVGGVAANFSKTTRTGLFTQVGF